MNVELLTVPECPHQPDAWRNLDEALARVGRTDVVVREHVVASAEEAARLGMHGSPTILIDGTDLFRPNDEPSLTCRFAAGNESAVPTVEQLIELLAS